MLFLNAFSIAADGTVVKIQNTLVDDPRVPGTGHYLQEFFDQSLFVDSHGQPSMEIFFTKNERGNNEK